MTLVAPFKYVLIDLTAEEQKEVKEFMDLQEARGDLEKSIGQKNDSKKICNVMWK